MMPDDAPGCPLPARDDASSRVTLAHGEGGRAARRLIRERILSRFDAPELAELGDAAVLPPLGGRPVLTTDAFVVSPLFFPGGDIGRLAVFGTVNDLAVAGALPRWLSCSLILEEGLPVDVLDRVLDSAAAAAREAGVAIVTGDTKVVPRGAADGLFVQTAGLGEAVDPLPRGPKALRPGDRLLVTGPIGRHGAAVMCAREELGLDPPPRSDCAPLTPAVDALRAAGLVPRALRDATRGGVAAVLHEWAEASGLSLTLDERAIPVGPDVRGVCELLGLDPLFLANEGTMVVAVDAAEVERALAALRGTAVAQGAAVVGEVAPRRVAPVCVRRALGRDVPLDEPAGAPLPRIC